MTVHEARDDAGQAVAAVVRDEDGRYHVHIAGQPVGRAAGLGNLDSAKHIVKRRLGAAA